MLDVLKAGVVIEGESVKMKRILPLPKQLKLSPFLRVDHFNIQQGGFPNQVHHGFEGLFYLFSGEIHHEDSLGNYFDMKAGGVELFTAGEGFLHSELVENNAHGIRIWIDLPADKKHMKPAYQRFEESALPMDENKSVLVRTVVGKGSPVQPQLNVEILDITLCSQSVYQYMVPEKFQGFLYVVVGSIKIRGKVIEASQTVYFKDEKDVAILSNTGARVLLCFGEPTKEKAQPLQSYNTI